MIGSGRGNWERATPGCSRAVRVTSLALLLALTVTAAPASSPMASAATCAIPMAAADARATPSQEAPPTAGPAGADIIQVEGELERAATPAAAASPVAAPAADPLATLTTELTAAAEALAACLSAGEAQTVTELAGERYLGQLFGGSVPLPADEYIAIAEQLTPIPTRIISLTEVARPADDRAVAMVTHVVGNQLMLAEWTFEQAPRGERAAGESRWRLAGERQRPAPAPRDAAVIDVEIGDRSFTLDETTVQGPDVVLRGSNDSDEDHEMLVLRLAPGYTTTDLLRATGPDLPAEATFIGELPVPAGDAGDLVLVDLEPGAYTLVCLFPDAQGTPHLVQGMEAVFTVE